MTPNPSIVAGPAPVAPVHRMPAIDLAFRHTHHLHDALFDAAIGPSIEDIA